MKRRELRVSIRNYPVWVLRITTFCFLLISPLSATWTFWKNAWVEYLEEVKQMWNIITGKELIED